LKKIYFWESIKIVSKGGFQKENDGRGVKKFGEVVTIF
jgi:hypothetical protein